MESPMANDRSQNLPDLLSLSINLDRKRRSNSLSLPSTYPRPPASNSTSSTTPTSPMSTINADTESELSLIADSPNQTYFRHALTNIADTGSKASSQSSVAQMLYSSTGQLLSPRSVSFADFCRYDRQALKHKEVLKSLVDAAAREPAMKSEKRRRGSSLSRKNSAFGKMAGFLKQSNKKYSYTRSGSLHLLRLAVHDNRTSFACKLMDEMPFGELIYSRKYDMAKIFVHAMFNCMESVCIVMLEHGFPQNVNDPALEMPMTDMPDFFYPSYFILAVSLGLDHVVRAMAKKANVNQDWYQIRPLHLACSSGNMLLVNLLLEHGALPTKTIGLDRLNMMHRLKSLHARKYGKMKHPYVAPIQSIVPSLSNHASSSQSSSFSTLKVSSDDGTTASQRVSISSEQQRKYLSSPQCQKLSLEALEYRQALLYDFSLSKSVLPLELALAIGNIALGKLLLHRTEHKALALSQFGLLLSRDFETTILLHKAGASMRQLDAFGNYPIHLACRRGDLEVVIALVICRADIDGKGENGWTPLHEATSRGEWDVTRLLVHLGANVNITNNSGLTPRELGMAFGHSADECDHALDASNTLKPALLDKITTVTNATNCLALPRTLQNTNNRQGAPAATSNGYTPPSASLLSKRRTGLVLGGAVTHERSPKGSLTRLSSRLNQRSLSQGDDESQISSSNSTVYYDTALYSSNPARSDSMSDTLNAASLSSFTSTSVLKNQQDSSTSMSFLVSPQGTRSDSPIPVLPTAQPVIKAGLNSSKRGPERQRSRLSTI